MRLPVMNNIKKNVLFVVPYNPLLGSKGAQGPKNVSQPLIRLLSAAHEVVLVVVSDDSTLSDAALLSAFPDVRQAYVCRPVTGWSRRIARLRYLLAGLPLSLADGVSQELTPLLHRHAKTSDLVHFEYFTLAPYIRLVRRYGPVQLHCHDAYSLYQKRCLQQAELLSEKLKALTRFVMFKNLESRLISKADVALTVSPVDQQYLARRGLSNVRYLPPAVQLVDPIIPVDRDEEPVELLCVVPATYHSFQATALRLFFRDVFPALSLQFPGKLAITLFGKTAGRLQDELRPFVHVEAVEFVEHYFSFLASRNWIYFYPQRAGAGLHTKVLDAMAAKLPVVGYVEILNAFCGTNWEHYIQCETAEEVVTSLATLVANPERRKQIGERGNSLLATRFASENVMERLNIIYAEIENGS
jgi:glycosyltransferase involved in cell wall biosynthesis